MVVTHTNLNGACVGLLEDRLDAFVDIWGGVVEGNNHRDLRNGREEEQVKRRKRRGVGNIFYFSAMTIILPQKIIFFHLKISGSN